MNTKKIKEYIKMLFKRDTSQRKKLISMYYNNENKLKKIDSSKISIVIQGPVFSREGHVNFTIESVKKHFPKSEIIFSTWVGEDLDFISKNIKIILSELPPVFFKDPLSFKALSAGSDKEGKLITDQLSIPGLEELYSDEEDAEEIHHEVVFTTNLPLEDYSKDEAISRIRQKFPDAHIDYQMNGVDDREFFDEEKDIDLT